jgi:cytochrome c biogenesis factor
MNETCHRQLIVVVKKTFRYSNVFFSTTTYTTLVFRNLWLKSGITTEMIAWTQSHVTRAVFLFFTFGTFEYSG